MAQPAELGTGKPVEVAGRFDAIEKSSAGGGGSLVAGLFGILNYLLGGVLFVALGIATLGIGFLLGFLTMWVVNSLLLVVTDKLTDHLTIDSFGWAMGGALMISMLSVLGNWLVGMVF